MRFIKNPHLKRIIIALVLVAMLAGCAPGDVLAPMYIQDLLPSASHTWNLGSPTLYWDEAYIANIHGDKVSATLVVAANDSLDADRADYQCDGVADDVEINAALIALPVVGGRVVLLEGNYGCITPILVPADATLEGQGWSTILNFGGVGAIQGITISGDNVWVKNLMAVITAGCGVAGTRPNAVYVQNQDQVVLENLYLIGDQTVAQELINQQNGIYFDNVDLSKITNCLIYGFHRNGIHNNNASDGNNINGNTCFGNTDYGIFVNSSSGCIINSNGCEDNDTGMVIFDSSLSNTITSNNCNNNTKSGLWVFQNSEDNTVTGNICNHNDWFGILVSGESTNNAITGNTCNYNDATRSGIQINESNENTVTGNQCSYNDMHGIHIYESERCTITGNTCNNNVVDGIQIEGTAAQDANYNTVVANQCNFNDDDGLEISGGTDCNYTVVDGNYLLDNTGTQYVDNGNQTQFWGGNTESEFELRPELHMAKIAGAGKPTLVNIGIFQGYSLPIFAPDEELFFSICVPQRWCQEHDIEVHIYCCIDQANATKNFNLELCWEHFTPGVDIVPATCNSVPVQTTTAAGAAPFQSYLVEFTIDYDIDVGDAIIIDDILGLRIRRLAAVAPEVTGEIIILHAGVVFVRDKVGSPLP